MWFLPVNDKFLYKGKQILKIMHKTYMLNVHKDIQRIANCFLRSEKYAFKTKYSLWLTGFINSQITFNYVNNIYYFYTFLNDTNLN